MGRGRHFLHWRSVAPVTTPRGSSWCRERITMLLGCLDRFLCHGLWEFIPGCERQNSSINSISVHFPKFSLTLAVHNSGGSLTIWAACDFPVMSSQGSQGRPLGNHEETEGMPLMDNPELLDDSSATNSERPATIGGSPANSHATWVAGA